METVKKHCRLCGDAIKEESCRILDDIMKQILDVLLLKLKVDGEDQSPVCGFCSTKLLEALNFKSICLLTDNAIIPHVDFAQPRPVDLKDVYMKQKGNKQGHMLDDQRICRLCLQPVGGEYISLQQVPIKMIQIYIPEMNFKVTLDPITCKKCYDSLIANSSFIRSCLEFEEKINKNDNSVSGMLAIDAYIKTEEIDIKSEEESDEKEEIVMNLQFSDIKLEGTEDESNKLSHRSEKGASIIMEENSKHLKQVVSCVPKSVKNYKSDECKYESKYKNHLRKRRLRHKQGQIYKCDKCKYETRRKNNLKKHMYNCEKDRSEMLRYKCDKCQYATKHSWYFSNHLITHKDPSEVPMYKCDKCKFETKYKASFTQHQVKHKDPSEMYKCDKCKFETTYKMSLTIHQLVHKDVQMYKCDKCEYETNNKYHFKSHMLRHKDPSEVQMYKCDKCKYEAKQKIHLKMHMLIHKDPSEVQMYKCDKCKFETKGKNYLTKHVLVHKDPSEVQMHKCYKCKFQTKRKQTLKAHELKHKKPSEVTMYKCNNCKYESKHKRCLRSHMLKHRGPVKKE